MEKITSENVLTVNVSKLALDSRFGSLIFDKSDEKLSKVQGWLKELNELNYQALLLRNDLNQIDNFRSRLVEHLEWLRNFDIGTVANAKQEHDNFDSRVDGFYTEAYSQILMRILPFLREERRRESPDQQKLDEEVKKVVKLRSELENELKNIKEEAQNIRITDKKVVSAKGERAAIRMAVYFDEEVSRYEKLSKYWLWGVAIGYILLLVVLICLGNVTLSFMNQVASSTKVIDAGSLWGIIVSKLVILAALWYGLSFVIKNYNVNSHLAAINRHRAAVAKTLEDFMAVEEKQEKPRLSETLKNATEAMFKHSPVGFVSKTEKETSSPVLQIINDLIGVGK